MGLYKTGSAAAGVWAKIPKVRQSDCSCSFPQRRVYGFIIGIIASGKLGGDFSTAQGWAIFGAVLPMAISGLVSGFFQGKSAVNCIYAVGKQDSLSGKLIVYPGMIEFYAILGLIISIMLVGKF
ncbi:MAG: V-type ATP synthase subunit K [Christensenellaceae bacterium]